MENKTRKRKSALKKKALPDTSKRLRITSAKRKVQGSLSKNPERDNSLMLPPEIKALQNWHDSSRGGRRFQRTRSSNRFKEYNRLMNQNLNAEYGEHPASLGDIEYLGKNKRHPGLGNYNEDETFFLEPDISEYYFRERKNLKKNRPKNRNNVDLARRQYLNRGQYELPFQERGVYDPRTNKFGLLNQEERFERDRPYHHEGHQLSGNIEGFGARGGIQHAQDWRDEDEYREGHATRKRGFGKFGSR